MVKAIMNETSNSIDKTSSECNGMADDIFIRADCSYTDLSEKYKTKSRDFTRQFFHMYSVRLAKMRGMVITRIREEWGPDIPIKKLIDLKEEEVERCVIIGTLFKHQEFKPSILKEISEEQQLAPQPPRQHFVDENDQLILEDEQQRIRLVGKLNVHSVVTGIVCGVLGRDTGGGKFDVDDFCWPYVSMKRYKQIPENKENRLIILISGMGVANNGDSLFPLQLFIDWVGGLLGDQEDQRQQARAVRVIVAGNSVQDTSLHNVPALVNSLKLDVEESIQAAKQLDDILEQLASYIDLDLMPGEFDPANHMLPQQPLHFCMFPKAQAYETLHGVTNPYECEVGGFRILGTSGQSITDISRYSKLSDRLDILEQTLHWGHLAPTCPDTLSGYPYYQEDPFIIEECPDIYFAGNQPQFQTKLLEGPGEHKTRLVCVPSFAKTHTCAVVELNTLDCWQIVFSATPFNDMEGVNN